MPNSNDITDLNFDAIALENQARKLLLVRQIGAKQAINDLYSIPYDKDARQRLRDNPMYSYLGAESPDITDDDRDFMVGSILAREFADDDAIILIRQAIADYPDYQRGLYEEHLKICATDTQYKSLLGHITHEQWKVKNQELISRPLHQEEIQEPPKNYSSPPKVSSGNIALAFILIVIVIVSIIVLFARCTRRTIHGRIGSMNTKEFSRVVGNMKILVDALEVHQVATTRDEQIEVLLWFWIICSYKLEDLNASQKDALATRSLLIIKETLSISGDDDGFVCSHLPLYQERFALYEERDNWSRNLQLLCKWSKSNDYKQGVVDGKVQLDLVNLDGFTDAFGQELKLQTFMKNSIMSIAGNCVEYLKAVIKEQPQKVEATAPKKLKVSPYSFTKKLDVKMPEEKKMPLSMSVKILCYIGVYFVWLLIVVFLKMGGILAQHLGVIPMLFIALVPKWATYIFLSGVDIKRGHCTDELLVKRKRAKTYIIIVTALNVISIIAQICFLNAS